MVAVTLCVSDLMVEDALQVSRNSHGALLSELCRVHLHHKVDEDGLEKELV